VGTGLAETHQTLRGNDLRGKVRVQTDGGLKTGLDVIKAAILGAESFGFGTAPMIALGCKYLRICHLNNCATGVATQNEKLRKDHYIGTVDMVVNFFTYVAEETREWLAKLGVRSRRADRPYRPAGHPARRHRAPAAPGPDAAAGQRSHPGRQAAVLRSGPQPAVRQGPAGREDGRHGHAGDQRPGGGEFSLDICNCDRSIGARISGEIARKHGNQGMAAAPITFRFKGTAGQSFGVWNAGGLNPGRRRQRLRRQGHDRRQADHRAAAGSVRNPAVPSSATPACTAPRRQAVRRRHRASVSLCVTPAPTLLEGTGDHCCEYMTGGFVCVLGKTGYNFGSGMTGGFAYVLDRTTPSSTGSTTNWWKSSGSAAKRWSLPQPLARVGRVRRGNRQRVGS
jgi:glutamate synthase (NADPH/NADH) large chain